MTTTTNQIADTITKRLGRGRKQLLLLRITAEIGPSIALGLGDWTGRMQRLAQG